MRILADLTKLALGVVFAAGIAGSAAAASLLSLPTKEPVLTGENAALYADPGLGVLSVFGVLKTLDTGTGPQLITATFDMVGDFTPVGPGVSDADMLIGGFDAAGFDPLLDFMTGQSTRVEVGSDYLAVLFGGLAGQGQPSFGSRALLVISNIVVTSPSPGQGNVVTATGDLTISAVTAPIPLPATAPLLLAGLGAVALLRRRRAAA